MWVSFLGGGGVRAPLSEKEGCQSIIRTGVDRRAPAEGVN
jgi:hypothetical protein